MFTNPFSKEIYEQAYQMNKMDGTPEGINGTIDRVAKYLASVEEDKQHWEMQFKEILKDFKFVPGGRILSNAGTGLTGTTMLNCYVSAPSPEPENGIDSIPGIMSELKNQAMILKSEGGYGVCADFMRPSGGFIEGIGNETPGSITFLELWDKQSEVITKGPQKKSQRKEAKGKIRKGAQMVTMSIWHPDIEEFIKAKQTPGRLTKFNMSVLITDEFINAVKNKKPWELKFPDYENKTKQIYNEKWNGNIKEWEKEGLPIKVYKRYENAEELWEIIMQSTYTRNEPGVLFVDTMNRMNNLYYCEHISATNPCGY